MLRQLRLIGVGVMALLLAATAVACTPAAQPETTAVTTPTLLFFYTDN